MDIPNPEGLTVDDLVLVVSAPGDTGWLIGHAGTIVAGPGCFIVEPSYLETHAGRCPFVVGFAVRFPDMAQEYAAPARFLRKLTPPADIRAEDRLEAQPVSQPHPWLFFRARRERITPQDRAFLAGAQWTPAQLEALRKASRKLDGRGHGS